jgi:cytochrome c peroxidase
MSLSARAGILLVGLAALGPSASRAAACPEHLQFLQSKCAQWQSHVLPTSLPAARGNMFADNQAAAALGMKIFYDNRFSQSGSGVACANCHDPEHAFAEKKPTSHTIREVARNAPDLLNAAWYARSHFWDGKVDNLWSAPLFTFEQDDEMGSSRLQVVHTLASIYKARYETIFGPLPDFSDTRRFPEAGKPGMPQFDAMSEQDKKLVNQVYANVGKALEAYVRKLAAGRAPFDDFVNGSAKSISADAQRGMVAFTRHGCDSCHSGPTFTDEGFHDLGYPGGPGPAKDPARAGGISFASKWPFSSTSQFADPAKGDVTVQAANLTGDGRGFRTPALRNLQLTYPYGHDGAFNTLESAIDAHSRVLPKQPALDAQDKHDIVAFLQSLNGRPPQAPWNYWPGG